MQPGTLSRQLRLETDEDMKNRRWIACMSLAAIGSMGLITAYQMGLIRHLPEPHFRGLDADKVDASEEAYSKLNMPDAALGLVSYSTTLGLAAMGGKNRARTQPWIPLALAAKAGVDAVQAAKLTYNQYAKHRAACMWCLIAAGATFATAVLVVPEARSAARELHGRR